MITLSKTRKFYVESQLGEKQFASNIKKPPSPVCTGSTAGCSTFHRLFVETDLSPQTYLYGVLVLSFCPRWCAKVNNDTRVEFWSEKCNTGLKDKQLLLEVVCGIRHQLCMLQSRAAFSTLELDSGTIVFTFPRVQMPFKLVPGTVQITEDIQMPGASSDGAKCGTGAAAWISVFSIPNAP